MRTEIRANCAGGLLSDDDVSGGGARGREAPRIYHQGTARHPSSLKDEAKIRPGLRYLGGGGGGTRQQGKIEDVVMRRRRRRPARRRHASNTQELSSGIGPAAAKAWSADERRTNEQNRNRTSTPT